MFKRTCWLLGAILFPLVLLVSIGQVEAVMGETAVLPAHVVIKNRPASFVSNDTVLIEAVHYYGYDGANDEAV